MMSLDEARLWLEKLEEDLMESEYPDAARKREAVLAIFKRNLELENLLTRASESLDKIAGIIGPAL